VGNKGIHCCLFSHVELIFVVTCIGVVAPGSLVQQPLSHTSLVSRCGDVS